MNDLKICPFCGGEAYIYAPGPIEHHVACKNPSCYAETHGWSTEAEAIEVWNTRVKPPCKGNYCPLCGAVERTCHNATHYAGKFKCSECGAMFDTEDEEWEPTLWVDGVASYPSFCPNCGAKVDG